MSPSRLHRMFCCVALLSLLLTAVSCDRSKGLKGQRNAVLTFYGATVDQDGSPLPGASIEYQVDAYPKDWTWNTQARPYVSSQVRAVSDANGRFQFTVTGCILRRLDAAREGYRHFCEEDSGGYPDGPNVNTYGYRLIAWSDPNYKTDPEHPAVFVFVKDGVHGVSALPCKGGYDSANGDGTAWRLNKPAWPRKPSLKDVVQKKPTTADN